MDIHYLKKLALMGAHIKPLEISSVEFASIWIQVPRLQQGSSKVLKIKC